MFRNSREYVRNKLVYVEKKDTDITLNAIFEFVLVFLTEKD